MKYCSPEHNERSLARPIQLPLNVLLETFIFKPVEEQLIRNERVTPILFHCLTKMKIHCDLQATLGKNTSKDGKLVDRIVMFFKLKLMG